MNLCKKIEKIVLLKRNAKIRSVEIMKNVPLHLETVQKPIMKP